MPLKMKPPVKEQATVSFRMTDCQAGRVLRKVVLFIAFVASTLGFLGILSNHLITYLDYPTATVWSFAQADDLPFPALSICSNNFKYSQFKRDFKVGTHPRYKDDVSNDASLPVKLVMLSEETNMTVSQLIWKYYFSAEEVVEECFVGSHSCEYPEGVPLPTEDHQERRIDVPAGTWVSRILSGSKAMEGSNYYMCHTLHSNVSMDLHIIDELAGNKIGIKWNKQTNFSRTVPSWTVYVHDAREHPMLKSYLMENLAYTTILKDPSTSIRGDDGVDGSSIKDNIDDIKNTLEDKFSGIFGRRKRSSEQLDDLTDHVELGHAGYKKKGKLSLSKYSHPQTRHHPCNASKLYSRYLCDLQFGWSRRFENARKAYTHFFRCQLPGIYPKPEDQLPICDRYAMNATSSSMGLINLINPSTIPLTWPGFGGKKVEWDAWYVLLPPSPLGVEMPSDCMDPCTELRYNLVMEEVTAEDTDLKRFDLKLYFPSKYIEVWEEHESYSPYSLFSDIGGTMGLLLGFSIMSLVELLEKSIAKMAETVYKSCFVRRA